MFNRNVWATSNVSQNKTFDKSLWENYLQKYWYFCKSFSKKSNFKDMRGIEAWQSRCRNGKLALNGMLWVEFLLLPWSPPVFKKQKHCEHINDNKWHLSKLMPSALVTCFMVCISVCHCSWLQEEMKCHSLYWHQCPAAKIKNCASIEQ